MAFELPALPYPVTALEPHIDRQTMEIHHGKHHQAYVTNLNNAVAGTELEGKTLEEIVKLGAALPPAVRNNGGGHWNHSLFWQVIGPTAGGEPSGPVADAIDKAFGSYEKFKEEFTKSATTRFGSGWAWLCKTEDGLRLCSTPNQDNPLMTGVESCGGRPILALDVWEHAYYLKYQNRRPEYITAFFNLINWDEVNRLFLQA